MTRRTRLEVLPLEERANPVMGGYDVPLAADIDDPIANTTTNHSGIVSYNGGTGFLLDRGSFVAGSRHIVTAAHVITPGFNGSVSFFRRLPDGSGNLQQVTIPVIDVYVHPDWLVNPTVTARSGDIAVLTLASVAPFGVADYALYQGSAEVGQQYFMGGYGTTGDGFSGQSNDEEVQRMTITATGGEFRIVIPRPGLPTVTTGNLPANATAAQIETAIETALGAGSNVIVSPITLGPLSPTPTSRSFEILFRAPNINYGRMSFQSEQSAPLVVNFGGGSSALGTVAFTNLISGGINPEVQRLTVNATGGTFTLTYGPNTTTPIAFDAGSPAARAATAARIQAALEALNQVALPGQGPGEVTVRVAEGGANDGTYQVVFDDQGINVGLLVANAAGLVGGARTVGVATVIDGGLPALRTGNNFYDRVDTIAGGTLESDFASTRPDDSEAQGDSGGPGFIIENGVPVVVSVVSGFDQAGVPGAPPRIAPFGTLSYNTRVSKYAQDVLDFSNGLRLVAGQLELDPYPLTLDMQYQFDGGDGVADVITVKQANVLDQDTNVVVPAIELYVRDKTGTDILYYRDALDRIESIRILGTSDSETFVIDPSVTKVVSVEGGFGIDTLIGPGTPTAWRLTALGKGTGDTATTDFLFQGIENLVGGTGDDTFAFDAAGSLAGTIDGGLGVDRLDFSAGTGTTVRFTVPGALDGFNGTTVPVAGGFANIDGFIGTEFGGGDTLVAPDTGGVFTHDGPAGVYVNAATNRPITYRGVDVLVGGAAADTFNVRAVTTALTIDGGAGDDTITVAGDAPVAGADGAVASNLIVIGGDGVDSFRLNGTAANEAVTARVAGPGSGDVLGATPAGILVAFNTLESFLFDGRGGANSFTALDVSNTSLGSPTDPGSGVVYYPTGPTGGNARMNGVTVGATAVGSVTVNGDPDGSGDRDVFLVVGTSASGLRSPYGEAAFGDGRDIITVSETQVTFRAVQSNTPLMPVQIGYTNGFQTFSTLYVAGGNERGNEGDTINLPTSLTFNVIADGMLPSASIRPGDRVVVSAPGGFDSQLVNDPSLGPPQVRVTARGDLSSAGIVGVESGLPAVEGDGLLAVGSDAGLPATIRVFDRATGAFRYELAPFEPEYTAGVKVAAGDVNGDGIADLVVAAGPGGGPRVAVFDGLTGQRIFDDFFAYESTFFGGVTVAIGDVNQDGFGDLILGTGVGGGPRVRVLSGRDLTPLRDVLVFEPTFRGGVSVAAGDVNGDGVPDLISSTGAGGGPRVVVLDGRNNAQLASFFVFDPKSRDGFFAAGGDVNGDGFADIIVGTGAGAGAQVRAFSGFNRAVLADFFVNEPFNPGRHDSSITAGVRVAVTDADGDGVGDIVTGLGPGGDAVIRTYKVAGVNPTTNALFPTLQEIRRQEAFDVGYGFGVFVGASD